MHRIVILLIALALLAGCSTPFRMEVKAQGEATAGFYDKASRLPLVPELNSVKKLHASVDGRYVWARVNDLDIGYDPKEHVKIDAALARSLVFPNGPKTVNATNSPQETASLSGKSDRDGPTSSSSSLWSFSSCPGPG